MIARGLTLLSALTLVVFLGGCGDSHESVYEDSLDAMEEFADILADVKDEESAKAAASKLEAWAEDMKDIKERMDKLGKPSEDQKKALDEEYKSRVEEVMGKFMAAMMKAGTNPHLRDVMEKVGDSMPDMK